MSWGSYEGRRHLRDATLAINVLTNTGNSFFSGWWAESHIVTVSLTQCVSMCITSSEIKQRYHSTTVLVQRRWKGKWINRILCFTPWLLHRKSTDAYDTNGEDLSKINRKQQQMEIKLTAAPENKCVLPSPLWSLKLQPYWCIYHSFTLDGGQTDGRSGAFCYDTRWLLS